MRRKKLTTGICAMGIAIAMASLSLSVEANGKFTELPAAGAAVDIGEGSSYIDVQASIESIVKDSSAYASNTSSVELQTIQNNVSVVRATESIDEQSVAGAQISSEAAYEENTQTIQPITAATVQEATTEPVSEEQMASTPEVIKADTVLADNTAQSGIADESITAEAATETNTEEAITGNKIIPTEELEIPGANVAVKEEIPAEYENLVIADVNDYVNVRAEANTESEIVGKLYDDSVGTLLKEENGWYQIQSGNVTGYVKAEFCVTGEEAIALAEEVGTRIATVNTTTLKVREEADIESSVIGLVPMGEELEVIKEEEEIEGWVKVSVEEGEGYVSTEYVSLRTDFVKAES